MKDVFLLSLSILAILSEVIFLALSVKNSFEIEKIKKDLDKLKKRCFDDE